VDDGQPEQPYQIPDTNPAPDLAELPPRGLTAVGAFPFVPKIIS
jgi:hypothetical protein